MWLKMANVAAYVDMRHYLEPGQVFGDYPREWGIFWVNPKLISTCSALGLQIDWSSVGLVDFARRQASCSGSHGSSYNPTCLSCSLRKRPLGMRCLLGHMIAAHRSIEVHTPPICRESAEVAFRHARAASHIGADCARRRRLQDSSLPGIVRASPSPQPTVAANSKSALYRPS
jgi:hypothetical protein